MLAAALTVSAIAPPACEIRAAQQSLSSVTEEAADPADGGWKR